MKDSRHTAEVQQLSSAKSTYTEGQVALNHQTSSSEKAGRFENEIHENQLRMMQQSRNQVMEELEDQK